MYCSQSISTTTLTVPCDTLKKATEVQKFSSLSSPRRTTPLSLAPSFELIQNYLVVVIAAHIYTTFFFLFCLFELNVEHLYVSSIFLFGSFTVILGAEKWGARSIFHLLSSSFLPVSFVVTVRFCPSTFLQSLSLLLLFIVVYLSSAWLYLSSAGSTSQKSCQYRLSRQWYPATAILSRRPSVIVVSAHRDHEVVTVTAFPLLVVFVCGCCNVTAAPYLALFSHSVSLQHGVVLLPPGVTAVRP